MDYNDLFIKKDIPNSLSKEEFYECFKKYKLGDQDAKNKIVVHYIRLVYIIVKKYSLSPYEQKELMAVGLEGLVKSINTFDINKGVKFSSYASKVINNEILLFMRRNKKYISNESLEHSIITDNNGNELQLIEILKDDNSDFVSNYVNREMHMIIRDLVANLPESEKMLVMMYYGFINDKIYSQKEIAAQLGITQSAVSRMLVRVVKKLEKQLAEMGVVNDREKRKIKKM